MTDPLAPPGYLFKNKKELSKTIDQLRTIATKLNELSFGDAAYEIERACAKVEHHTREDTWTRLARATVRYLGQNLANMPPPSVSVSYLTSKAESLHVQMHIKLDGTVQEFIDRYDTEINE